MYYEISFYSNTSVSIHHIYVFDVKMIGEKSMSSTISEYKAGSSACDINPVPVNKTCPEGEIDGE